MKTWWNEERKENLCFLYIFQDNNPSEPPPLNEITEKQEIGVFGRGVKTV
jgi:hypothetical protein